MANLEFLNETTFKEKVFNYEKNKDWKFEGTLPAIVDFYADWCGPCRMISPVLDQLQAEYEGKINIYKINTEEEQNLAGMFGIQSIPSLLFIPLGDQPQMSVGAHSKDEFKKMIKSILKVE